LDETTGTAAADSSGYGHNGTADQWPDLGDRPGGWRGKFFDGSNDCISVDNVGVNTVMGGCNTGGVLDEVEWRRSPDALWLDGNYDLLLYNGSFGDQHGERGDTLGISSAGLATNWVHVAVVFSKSEFRLHPTRSFTSMGVAQTVTLRRGTSVDESGGHAGRSIFSGGVSITSRVWRSAG